MLRRCTIETNRFIACFAEVLQSLFLMVGAAPEHIRHFGLFFGYILKKLILKMVQRIVLRMLVKLSVVIVLNGRRPEKLGVRCVNRYDFRKISI